MLLLLKLSVKNYEDFKNANKDSLISLLKNETYTTYNDIMFASRVNKTINPDSGKDTIYSNSKPEDTTPVTVNNSAGNDTYFSGEGRDIFISGTGSNTFVFSNFNIISKLSYNTPNPCNISSYNSFFTL